MLILIRMRIQILIKIQGFDDQKLVKNFCGTKKLYYVLSVITINISLGLHKERPSYRRSLRPSKENIQHFKT
jgi:hypothetical protein